MLNGLWERESDKAGAIQAGATNLTIFSTIVAALGACLIAFTDLSNKIIGPDTSFDHDVLRVVLLVAIIVTGTLIVMADLRARSRVAAASERSAHLFAVPDGLQAHQRGVDHNFDIHGIRFDGDDGGSAKVLVRTADNEPLAWRELDGDTWTLVAGNHG